MINETLSEHFVMPWGGGGGGVSQPYTSILRYSHFNAMRSGMNYAENVGIRMIAFQKGGRGKMYTIGSMFPSVDSPSEWYP